MRKTLNTKIDDISDYVNTASKKNNKHKEFIRLVELHKNSTLSKADLDKLRMITDFFIAEKHQKAKDKKLKQIERKEKKKAKSDERRNYERQCFLLGGALLKLKIDDTEFPKFILTLCEMIVNGLLTYDNLKEFKEFDFEVITDSTTEEVNKNTIKNTVEEKYIKLKNEKKEQRVSFSFALEFTFKNNRYSLYPFSIAYINNKIVFCSFFFRNNDVENNWNMVHIHENSWHHMLKFKLENE